MRRLAVAVVALLAILMATFIARPYGRGLSFVIRAADMSGRLRAVADLGIGGVSEREIAIPTSNGTLRSRVYAPTRSTRRAVLLVSGLHPSGIDEPRLVRFSRNLSADNVLVVTPAIPELTRFLIS